MSEKRIEILLCSAPEDKELSQSLEFQLYPLEKTGSIEVWPRSKIEGSNQWREEIAKHIDTAEIILLLISPVFIYSEYHYIVKAMEQYKLRDTRVIPIILRPTIWKDLPCGMLLPLPKDGEPVTTCSNPEVALYEVAKEIQKVVDQRLADLTIVLEPIPEIQKPAGQYENDSTILISSSRLDVHNPAIGRNNAVKAQTPMSQKATFVPQENQLEIIKNDLKQFKDEVRQDLKALQTKSDEQTALLTQILTQQTALLTQILTQQPPP